MLDETLLRLPAQKIGGPDMIRIPFNRPFATGKEIDYIRAAVATPKFSGDVVNLEWPTLFPTANVG